MRVLMTADTVGGVWGYALDLADGLADHGVEVVLATMGPLPTPSQRSELDDSAVLDVRSLACRLEWMDDPWDDVAHAGEWLLELGEEVDPDLVHLNGYAHAVLPWRAPVLVAGHSCVLSWWRAVKGAEAPRRFGRYRRAVADGLAAADLVVAPSVAMLRELELLYRPPAPLRAIPNGRRPSGVVAPKEPLVLSAGRLWDEAKNVATLDRVAPWLPWPILVAGSVDGGPNPRHVRPLGLLARRELDGWLARAPIFALPARYEPFGLAAVEAGHAGAALVLGDLPSQREVWGDAALFVDPDDDRALLAALTRLIDDDTLRARLAAAARARAAELTPRRMADRYAEAYAGLVRQEVAA